MVDAGTGLLELALPDMRRSDHVILESAATSQGVRMKLYISGPMTDYEEFNYPAFHAAKEALQARGYDVISPADLPLREDWEWIDYIIADIASVFQVDGVALLDGWEASKGARIECEIAAQREIPVLPTAHWLDVWMPA